MCVLRSSFVVGAQKGVIDVVESKKNFTEMKHLRHTISVNKWRGGNSSSQSEQRDGFGKNQGGKGKLFVVTVDRERENKICL